MMSDLTMPRLSDSMEEGTILTWLRANGEFIEAGEDLVEIETDKATVTHPAEASGILTILAPEGTSLQIGAPIARVDDQVEARGAEPQVSDIGDMSASTSPPPTAPAPLISEGNQVPTAASGAPTAAADPVSNGRRAGAAAAATPLARRIAQAHGVLIAEITGSGPLGRVTRADVLARAGAPPSPSPPPARARTQAPPAPKAAEPAPVPAARSAVAPSGTSSAKGEPEIVELSRLQTVVARRMAEAKATIPHFQIQTDVHMDSAIAFRDQIKQSGANAPSFNDFVVKAAALALREHPLANGAYRDGRFELYPRVNVGIAVAAEGALVVPTIFDADQKSLGAIAVEARRLSGLVRDGTVTPAELSGATFTVSNLGMYGMTAIAPVVNIPQAAILGVGTLRETLVRVDGEVVDTRLMTLTLSCDHRILYGAEAAQFLSAIRQLLEQPLRLAL